MLEKEEEQCTGSDVGQKSKGKHSELYAIVIDWLAYMTCE
jgi:hypothetical protein